MGTALATKTSIGAVSVRRDALVDLPAAMTAIVIAAAATRLGLKNG